MRRGACVGVPYVVGLDGEDITVLRLAAVAAHISVCVCVCVCVCICARARSI